LYDGDDIIAEYDAGGTLIASYIHGPGVDEPIQMTRGGSAVYYTADGLGSIRDLTNSSQNIVEQYSYDSFGNLPAPPTTGNPYTFTGREHDPETGLLFYRARYYDPKVGRFLQEDPKGFDGGDVNFYAYVAGNPINAVDPYGLTSQPGFLEGMIPIWGSGKAAINDFECGRYGWAAVNTALAVSDIFAIKALVMALAKAGVKISVQEVLAKLASNRGSASFFGAAEEGAKTFFEGATYSPKVLNQMSKADDMFHAFPKSVDGFATKFGKWTTQVGSDGKTYQWLKMPGSYGGKTGVFEYTKDANGIINHRFFRVTP
jgi:RHS repeat-associated protein